MKGELRLEITVYFTLKLISSVYHFRDVQNRVKDKKRKGSKSYLNILQNRKNCGIPIVQNGISNKYYSNDFCIQRFLYTKKILKN